MNKANAKIKLIISMAVFGTISIFVKGISLPSGEIALYRAVLASILIGLFLLFTKQRIDFKKIRKELPLLIISGMAMGFNWIFLFEAYKHTSVSAATLGYYFAPIIVTLVCPILFKEKMQKKQWLCFIMSTLGIILITVNGGMSEGSNHLLGISLSLIAACLYATVILINKFIRKIDGIHRTFLQFLSAICVLLPYSFITEELNILSLDFKGWCFLLTVGLIHTGITYCIYFSSLGKLSGQETAILSYIDPLVAVMISVFILKEGMTPLQIIGGILILGFTLINELNIDFRQKHRK